MFKDLKFGTRKRIFCTRNESLNVLVFNVSRRGNEWSIENFIAPGL